MKTYIQFDLLTTLGKMAALSVLQQPSEQEQINQNTVQLNM